MAGITNATFTSQDWAYFKYPMSLSPIPQFMKPGIIALCAFSLLSCIATLSLLGFLAYRFIIGRNDHQAPLYKNQYMLLIFSLVLADFQCDLGFFLDVIWLHKKQIVAPSVSCFIQGWLVNIGDLGSGFFVFAIACHTFYNVVCGRKLELATLRLCIVGLWVFAIVLTIVPIALHPKNIFVTQGNWCSINSKYDILRLYFHYIWVFIAEAAVLIMYTTTFLVLRKRMGSIVPQLAHTSGTNGNRTVKDRNSAQAKISRATMYMILYPLIYVISTLPLAAGRISSMVGHAPTKQYLVGAGTLMACGGWMNCLLYSLTRQIFLTERLTGVQEINRSRYGPKSSVMRSTDGGIEMGTPGSKYRELPSPVASTDDIVKTGGRREDNLGKRQEGVVMETTWEVQIEEARSSVRVDKGTRLGHQTFVS